MRFDNSLQAPVTCGILLVMRLTLIALVLALVAGCASTPPAAITTALEGNLSSLQLAEAELLPLIDNTPILDFGQVGGAGPERLYHARDGWRILLRTHQVRAASLLAWARDEAFDQATAIKALVVPALEEATANLSDDE